MAACIHHIFSFQSDHCLSISDKPQKIPYTLKKDSPVITGEPSQSNVHFQTASLVKLLGYLHCNLIFSISSLPFHRRNIRRSALFLCLCLTPVDLSLVINREQNDGNRHEHKHVRDGGLENRRKISLLDIHKADEVLLAHGT